MKTTVQCGVVLGLLTSGFILRSGQEDLDLMNRGNIEITLNTMRGNTGFPNLDERNRRVGLTAGSQPDAGMSGSVSTRAARANSSHLLKVIPPPVEGSRIVFARQEGTLLFHGSSSLSLQCGICTTTLAEGVNTGQLTDIVLYCNHCGAFNDTEDCTGLP